MITAHFSMPNSIPMTWQYILTDCFTVSCSFSFLANGLISSMYIRWLIFSCDLQSLYPPAHFLSVCLSGIIAITNSKDKSKSPWKVPLGIFTSGKLFFPAVFSTFLFFMVFSIKLISCIFWDSLLSKFRGPYHMPFRYQSMPFLDICVPFLSPWGCANQYTVALLYL